MNELVNVEKNKTARKEGKKKKEIRFKKGTGPTVAIVISIIMIFATVLIFMDTISNGASALADSYSNAYNEQKEATYQEKYDAYKNSAEEKFRVSNRVSIYVGNLKEEEKLEVLKVSDVEFIIDDRSNNEGHVISWLEVPGEGTYIVDLKAGEYVVDNERSHVLVRVPYPELTNITIDYANVQKILFKDDFFNGSYKEGEELARQQLSQAELLIKKEFASNQNFYLNAQAAAVSTIETLVKQLNPEVDNLVVDVEFY